MELFTTLGVVWAVWMVLKIIVTRLHIEQQTQELKEQLSERIRVVELEHVEESGNVILAYDKENNRFLGQAMDVDGIKTALMDRFPRQVFILNDEVFSAMPMKK